MWKNPCYRGNIIRWNYFDSIFSDHGPAGVRLDDYISGFMVSENIFRKEPKGGFGAIQAYQGKDSHYVYSSVRNGDAGNPSLLYKLHPSGLWL